MKWRPFRYGQEEYDLCHLDPVTITYIQEATGDNNRENYSCKILIQTLMLGPYAIWPAEKSAFVPIGDTGPADHDAHVIVELPHCTMEFDPYISMRDAGVHVRIPVCVSVTDSTVPH